MATRNDKPRLKAEQRRQLTIFFNKDARKSAADALKKASWMLAAANVYLGFTKGSVVYMAIVVFGWLVAQTLAVILLSIEEKGGSQEPKEQQHERTSGIRGTRPECGSHPRRPRRRVDVGQSLGHRCGVPGLRQPDARESSDGESTAAPSVSELQRQARRKLQLTPARRGFFSPVRDVHASKEKAPVRVDRGLESLTLSSREGSCSGRKSREASASRISLSTEL